MADAPDALESIKELLAEIGRETERLRTSQTQHAAMAVAGRMLAADLPSALIAQIQADLDSGDLSQIGGADSWDRDASPSFISRRPSAT